MTTSPDPVRAGLAALLQPFPPEAISHLPRSTCRACSDSPRKRCDRHTWIVRCEACGGSHSSATMHLDYVGHADATRRLLEVDPAWTWEPLALGPDGLPARDADGGLWIRLTVLGVTRLGYGDAQGKRGPNAVKECIGDAIRNAAMRFGVALDLWSKSDAAEARKEAAGAEPEAADPAALEAEAQGIADQVAEHLGDRDFLLPLYQRVQHQPVGAFPVGNPVTGEVQALAALIVWAGQQPPPQQPEQGAQEPAQGPGGCEAARKADGAPCTREAGHEGRHTYATEEQSA